MNHLESLKTLVGLASSLPQQHTRVENGDPKDNGKGRLVERLGSRTETLLSVLLDPWQPSHACCSAPQPEIPCLILLLQDY